MTDLLSLPSGLRGAWLDARHLLADVSFARPALLWLGLVPIAVTLASVLAARCRASAFSRVGRPAALAALLTGRRPGRLARLALAVAWPLLVVGAAGPRWGEGGDPGAAEGRDVVVVVDLSRSMLADDVAAGTRWQAAVFAATDLVDALRVRGGHRAALVVFAARPSLVVPLTTDYAHLTAKLAELDAAVPPPDVRPADDSKSGTRIGAALAAAVAAHDPRFPGYQHVVLFSDGDDPVPDREWEAGVTAARAAHVPVHVVGLGDPDHETQLYRDKEPVEYASQPGGPKDSWAQSRLHEDVLKAVASAAADGSPDYLPARREPPRMGDFFRTRIEAAPPRDLPDDALPQPKDRSAWFLGLGLACLLFAWFRGR